MTQVLDYVWVNEEYEIIMESMTSEVIYNNLNELPHYCFGTNMIKPTQVFKNPFKSHNDMIVLCDMYTVNNLTYPPQILLAEHNQRSSFDEYMESFPSEIFQITQAYKYTKNLFQEHKKMCKYVGVDVFGKPSEYTIYTNKENVYNYVWISRYILFQLSLTDIEWTCLKLSPNNEVDVSKQVKNMEITSIDDMLDGMSI